jgi:hypothetical protein
VAEQRQFHVSAKKRTFFDRKIIKTGFSRGINVSKLIPIDWRYVRMELLSGDKTSVTVKITKLLGEEPIAQAQKVNKDHRQDS